MIDPAPDPLPGPIGILAFCPVDKVLDDQQIIAHPLWKMMISNSVLEPILHHFIGSSSGYFSCTFAHISGVYLVSIDGAKLSRKLPAATTRSSFV